MKDVSLNAQETTEGQEASAALSSTWLQMAGVWDLAERISVFLYSSFCRSRNAGVSLLLLPTASHSSLPLAFLPFPLSSPVGTVLLVLALTKLQ